MTPTGLPEAFALQDIEIHSHVADGVPQVGLMMTGKPTTVMAPVKRYLTFITCDVAEQLGPVFAQAAQLARAEAAGEKPVDLVTAQPGDVARVAEALSSTVHPQSPFGI